MYISSLYDFSVSFEAVKGKGWSGDIALDDIKVISIYQYEYVSLLSYCTLLCYEHVLIYSSFSKRIIRQVNYFLIKSVPKHTFLFRF